MDPERARIQADLSGQIDGQIRCDDIFLQMYASDASIYSVRPLAVVRPSNINDIVACVKYAKENDIALIPRGGGSNVVGASIGGGIVLDFSASMRRVEAVGRSDVTVQPGVVLGVLNNQLKPHGQMVGPDPATRNITTVGGVLSMNSSGSHWIRYGEPRDKVIRLKVVLANGDVVELSSNKDKSATRNADPKVRSLSNQVRRILTQNEQLIKQHRPNVNQNQAGYNIFDLLQVEPSDEQNSKKRQTSKNQIEPNEVDLTRLIVGSEGTLGIIAEATLQTEPIPRHRGVAILFFHQISLAAQATLEISKMGAVACDVIDRRLLSLARETNSEFRRLIASEAEAMLLVEFQAADNRSLQTKLDHLTNRIQRRRKLAFDIRTTTQEDQRNLYWRIVRRIVPTMFKLKGQKRALPFIEDIAVHPSKLPEMLQDIHRILNENEVTASIHSHALQGLIHVRPFMNLSSNDDLTTMQRLANQIFEKVLEHKGSVSGSHGDGLSRTWFLRRQYGPSYNLFTEIKNVFDPDNRFNPGKIVGHPHSGLVDNLRRVQVDDRIRPVEPIEPTTNTNGKKNKSQSNPDVGAIAKSTIGASSKSKEDPDSQPTNGTNARPAEEKRKPNAALPIVEPVLTWSLDEIAMSARNCNGCGRCRTQSSRERMCPMFRLIPQEEASPRAKANLVRGVVTGELDPKLLTQDEFKNIVDLCVNCHQCRTECPAGVDIPKLMVEAKAQFYAVNGLKISDWLLTRLDWLYGLAGQMPMVTNFLLQNRLARWFLDRLLGVAQGRKLPLFASQTFTRWSTREKLNRPTSQSAQKIVYFVDAFVNWNDVELGKAFVKIVKRHGIDVYVPTGQSVSGMSLISEGSLARAKRLATRNVELLAESVRQGYRVVTTEPSAALALKHEYLNLLDDADAELVAKNTTDATSFLLELHRTGDLQLDFKPVNASIGYHLPCHQRVLGPEVPAVELLRLIPSLQVEMIEKGCSGMAGTFGIKRRNYLRSLRMGFSLINAMRSPNIIAGTTECSTCKIQMEQGTTKPTIHPIKILAMAYGLMPELENLFSRRSGELVVS